MSERTIVTVALKDLKTSIYVRQELNPDHALFLAELIEGGVELPPIRITKDMVVIDGRHRIEACLLNGLHEIKAEIVGISDENELIASAYQANVGGSLPPTTADTEHTIMLLLDRGVPKKQIGELLKLPPGMARKYVNNVQSKSARQKLMAAARSVTDGGLTVAKAAEQHGVDQERLKEVLSGRRKKNKGGVADIQRALTFTFKSLGAKNAALFRGLLDKYEDGDVTGRQVGEIFEHLSRCQTQSARAVADWKKRFESMTAKTAKAA